MGADSAGAGARPALARRRRAPPALALERTSDARAPSATGTLPQVLRVVRLGMGRAERSPAAGQRAPPRGARRGRPPPALLLPGPPGGNTEARGHRAEARRR